MPHLLPFRVEPHFNNIDISREKINLDAELTELLQQKFWLEMKIDKTKNAIRNVHQCPFLHFKIIQFHPNG